METMSVGRRPRAAHRAGRYVTKDDRQFRVLMATDVVSRAEGGTD